MPPKVLPVRQNIQEMIDVLAPRGFYPVYGLQRFRERTKDEYAIPPRPRKDAELGLAFDKDDLGVVAWTTWLPASQQARENDRGWIIIEQAGKRRYVLSLRRTKNFTQHMILEARIARCRVRTRPVCETCKVGMNIVYGRGIGARYWRCPICRARESWDHKRFLEVLSSEPEAARYLARRRKKRDAGQEKCRKAGKPIRQEIFIRKGWVRIKLPVTDF